jgi:hypothetical protein
MALFADLSGIPIVRGSLVLSYGGLFHADVTLDRAVDPPLSGAQLLNLGGTVYTCSVVRSLDFVGSRSVRLVGGQGGWRKDVPPKQYNEPSGISTAAILRDVAVTVGELVPVLDVSTPNTVFDDFVRGGGAASLVLTRLLGDGWWMDTTGAIKTGPRLSTPITSDFSVESVRGASGIVTVHTEDVASWTPGRTFSGPTIVTQTINRIEHVIESGSFSTRVMVT